MKRYFLFFLLCLVTLVACNPQPQTVTPTSPGETLTWTPTIDPTPTPSPVPPKTLTVCTAQLPESLTPYDGPQTSTKTFILNLLYEGPLDSMNDDTVPVLLDRVPSQTNGDVRMEPFNVQRGQTVVDAEGELAVLKPGLHVRPSGCRAVDCAMVWDGETSLQMDRMVVDFRLREDLTWSDGVPVTAGDSVFRYRLADALENSGLYWAEDRTDAFTALDSQLVQWVGRPGFSTSELERFLWTPLPSHLFEDEEGWLEIANAETLAVSPLSYGPYMVNARKSDLITLIPNPDYYLADESISWPDVLNIRQIEGGRTGAIEALQSGECDVLDSSFGWENDPDLLSEINSDVRFEIRSQTGEVWWQLVFDIVPAAYDDAYNPALGDRPNFFGDPLVRGAIASCLDRDAMAEHALGEWAQLWPSFLPPALSQISAEDGLRFDPEQGAAILEAAGWLDNDADPVTPRIAVNVPDVPVGTALRLNLLVDETGFQQDMADIIQQSLAGCGIGVDIETLPPERLYAPGPGGPLFGRRFDLALIAWGAGPELDCRLYLDQAIPNQGNQWVGTNIAGFAWADYDRACTWAGLAVGGDRSIAMLEAEREFLNQLPAVPLFSPPRVLIIATSLYGEEILTQGKGLLNTLDSLMGD